MLDPTECLPYQFNTHQKVVKQQEGKIDVDTKIFSPLAHYPVTGKAKGTLFWSLTWVTGTQILGQQFSAFLGALAEATMEVEQLGFKS